MQIILIHKHLLSESENVVSVAMDPAGKNANFSVGGKFRKVSWKFSIFLEIFNFSGGGQSQGRTYSVYGTY